MICLTAKECVPQNSSGGCETTTCIRGKQRLRSLEIFVLTIVSFQKKFCDEVIHETATSRFFTHLSRHPHRNKKSRADSAPLYTTKTQELTAAILQRMTLRWSCGWSGRSVETGWSLPAETERRGEAYHIDSSIEASPIATISQSNQRQIEAGKGRANRNKATTPW